MSLHVIVGAGPTGVAAARLLADSGDSVRLVSRRGSGPEHPRIERIAADASDPARLTEITHGARTLANCAMPAYDRWPAEYPPIAAALLTAAERTGAGLALVGNTYVYGPQHDPLTPMTPDLPIAPTTVKGRVRAQMWEDALAAHRAGRVRVLEVRGSDYLGAGAGSLYTLMTAPRVIAGEPAAYVGDFDAPHSWTYTVDVARTLVAAAQTEDAWGRAWHVPSVTLSARELTARIAAIAGRPTPALAHLSADAVREIGATDSIMREVVEMLYLFERPSLLDFSDTRQAFGLEPVPLDELLTQTVHAIAAASATIARP